MAHLTRTLILAALSGFIASTTLLTGPAAAQKAAGEEKPASDKVVAEVNGKKITEADLALADAEIGRELGQLPPETKRFALTEFLIENQLLADEAEKAQLATAKEFEERIAYWRRRALRETYFEKKMRATISEAAARTFYDNQVKQIKPEDEVQARHILVNDVEKIKEIAAKIKAGEDFAKLAAAHSQDPGTKGHGGMLGYFSKGQMVPEFERTAFALKKGEVSEPVKSQFGWHLIKLEDRRKKPIPAFADVKDRVINTLVYQRHQEFIKKLRDDAELNYQDEGIRKEVIARDAREAQRRKMIEAQIKATIDAEKAKKETKAGDKK